MDLLKYSDSDDAELVLAARQGNESCYCVLVERYWAIMVGLALCKVKDTDEAEDIAQEAFVEAWRQLGRLRDPASFAGFLGRMVRNKVADAIRQHVRERTVSLSDVPESRLPATDATSGNPGLTDEGRNTIRRAILRLPEKFQIVILMRFVSGLSTHEIARRLDKRPGTVRVWLHRAYKKLRKDLAPLARKEASKS